MRSNPLKIYTKAGDQGNTAGLDQKPLSKDDPRIETIGGIDELNSCLGMVASLTEDTTIRRIIDVVQHDLFSLGSYFSSEDISFIHELDVSRLESQIDDWTNHLPTLRNFILPGGSLAAAQAHVARAICRRAERRIVTLNKHRLIEPRVLQYINRLSDWLFTLARYLNMREGAPEKLWERSFENRP